MLLKVYLPIGLVDGQLEINDVYPHVQDELRANPNVSQETIAKQRARRDIALQRMNELHGKYAIRNGDYLYTLSLFIAEPIKWINKYEWRKLDPIEEYVSIQDIAWTTCFYS